MTVAIVVGVVALALGLVIGWLLASRHGVAEMAAARVHVGQHDLTRLQLGEVIRERDEATRALDAHRAVAVERERAWEERAQAEAANRELLKSQFAEASRQALDDAQAKFLQRADERFRQSETTSGQNLKALLQPVHERLERYEQGVAKVEAERRDAFGDLKGQIESMRVGSESVRAEASKLVNALRNAPKARGRWGEQQLRNVLESCGLSDVADFQVEVSVADGEGGRLRPDVIIHVPGGNHLVIDAKVSLNDYQDAFGAIDDAERALGLQRHAASMRAHVNALGAKAYWSQVDDAPDYVIMFVPGEHFLSAALEQDPGLWDFAFDRRVLLATPTNLIAIARTVAAVWRQEKLAGEAREIAELGKELYARLAVMGGHVAKLGRNIGLANDAYNAFVGSLETQVLTQAKRFEDYNIDTAGRSIESPPIIEQTPRPLVKLASVSEIADRSAEA
ncbi:MAG: DNA recombination protein RmuC [Sphingomonas sp.]